MKTTKKLVRRYLNINSEQRISNIISVLDNLSEVISQLSGSDFTGIFYSRGNSKNYVPISYAFSDDTTVHNLNELEAFANGGEAYSWFQNPESDDIDARIDFSKINGYNYRLQFSYKENNHTRVMILLYWKSKPDEISDENEISINQLAQVINNIMLTIESINHASNYSMRLFELTNIFEVPLGKLRFSEFIHEIFVYTKNIVSAGGINLYSKNNHGEYILTDSICEGKCDLVFNNKLSKAVNELNCSLDDDQKTIGKQFELGKSMGADANSIISFYIYPDKGHQYLVTLWNERFESFDVQNMELLKVFSLYSQSLLKNALLFRSIKRSQKMMERKSLRLIDLETTAALADMTSGVAHEFNNIIGGVVGRLQLLKMKNSDDKMEHELEKVEKMLMEGAHTIKRIQEFTIGTKSKNLIPENIKEVVTDLIDNSSKNFHLLAQKQNVSIELEIEEDNPIVSGNFVDLSLALEKVIENAVENSDNNASVKIGISGDDKYIRIKIADTGPGIPRANRQKIFYPFFTSKFSKAAGLSLSIVHGIINQINGKIKIRDNDPKGTIFEIILYRDVANQDITDTSNTGGSKEFLNILVVDDDKEIREVLSDMLSIYGHDVTTCPDAYDALKTLDKAEFDLMITDLGMPGMSGMELAGVVNKDFPDTSIAMITGWGTQLNNDDVKEVGIRRVLSKPFHMNDIRELIKEVV